MKLLQMTKNFLNNIKENHKQKKSNNNNTNINDCVTLQTHQLETDDMKPWWWFGSETQVREDWEYITQTSQFSHTDIEPQPDLQPDPVMSV
ncbi:MAG: hypothetical protein QNJ68_14080 [Microcoleaceae cyanobacterium MO_207.B10]|nr:hypothetical protein [Microcoleaceae cyanobacterium MO_207.B10]